MSEPPRYGVGLLGCGRACSELHLPALRKLPGVYVAALADADAGIAEAVGDRFAVRARATDVQGLLAAPGVDIVAVCVPAADHVAAALPVIEAGKHLLIEKPLATDRAGCERLTEAAANSGSRITVGFNLRYHRLVQAARALIREGALGPIEAVSSAWISAIRRRQTLPDWRNSRASGGGALFEIAVHHFDLWRYLLDTEISEIHAHARAGQWPDETVAVSAQLANGAVASGVFSERSSDRNQLRIMGREGCLSLDLFRFDGLEFTPADEQPGFASRLLRSARAVTALPRGFALARQGGDFLLSYQHEWRAFLGALESGSEPSCTLHDGFSAVRAVLAAIESADSHRPVQP